MPKITKTTYTDDEVRQKILTYLSDCRKKARGLDCFIKKLQEVGWVDENGISLRCFNMEYADNNEEGNHYIEWNADLIK